MIAATGAAVLAILAVSLAALVATRERTTSMLSGFEAPAAHLTERVPLPMGPLIVAVAVAAGLVGYLLNGLVGSLAAMAAVAIAPRLERRRRARRFERRLHEHLAEAVELIATAMRSGRSLLQAIELAADELDPWPGATFRRLVDRTELGNPMDEAIDAWAAEVGGPDPRLVAGVLKLHRRTGGSLSAALEDLAGTLRSRRSATREIESLTAQARLSATILGLLPIGFFLFLSVVARDDLEAAYQTRAGVAAIGVGFALQGAAYLWIRSLLRVEP